MGAGPNLYMGGLSVLVVESNAQEREIIAQMLSGFRVNSVSKQASATDAMACIQRSPADLLIVAAALPNMDGYDFTRWLRTTETVSSRMAPVLLLTGHTRIGDVTRARDCGASVVIARPITPLSCITVSPGWLTIPGHSSRPRPTPAPTAASGRLTHQSDAAAGEMICLRPCPPWQQADENRTAAEPPCRTYPPARRTADEAAVRATEANRHDIRNDVINEIEGILDRMHAIETAGDDAQTLDELYTLANNVVGMAGLFGMSGLGQVCFGLCELLDRLRSQHIQDAPAVRVHMGSLHLLRPDSTYNQEQQAAVVAALRCIVVRL